MRSFASDNNSGVHPTILQALLQANTDHAVGYGDDKWTQAAQATFKQAFGEQAETFLVFNGTGANSVALQAITRPYHAIITTKTAHIFVDECGAPAKMSGCTLFPVETPDGKLTVEHIKPFLGYKGSCHHPQPKVVYISQTTELGTIYTLDELRTLSTFLHENDMFLHMDGARLANACAQLGCTFKEATVDVGVDLLSFGGTKNGMMLGEAVVCFLPNISQEIAYIRKQSAQLSSKMRYLSAQYIPYFENELWRENATKANHMAARLKEALSHYPSVCFTQKVESNQLFFSLPRKAIDRLLEKHFFYIWNAQNNEIRLVTSWDTTEQDIAQMIESFEEVL